METIILVIHLILAVAIIGLVLVQRSAGGGLGIGGGGGGAGDFASARGTANLLTKLTTYFAIAFFATSLSLGYIAANNGNTGVLDAMEADEISIEIPTNAAPVETVEPEVPVAE